MDYDYLLPGLSTTFEFATPLLSSKFIRNTVIVLSSTAQTLPGEKVVNHIISRRGIIVKREPVGRLRLDVSLKVARFDGGESLGRAGGDVWQGRVVARVQAIAAAEGEVCGTGENEDGTGELGHGWSAARGEEFAHRYGLLCRVAYDEETRVETSWEEEIVLDCFDVGAGEVAVWIVEFLGG